MTVETLSTTQSTTIVRCAVCKVDLKGRFVYIDERIEKLLGKPCEDLFGKPFTGFLDQASRLVVNEVFTRRNHYETFYDSIPLTFIDARGVPRQTTAMVTLNYNAGNPVNFQWIINPEEAAPVDTVAHPSPTEYRNLMDYLAGCDFVRDWRGFVESLRQFTRARLVGAYIVKDDHLELRSGTAEHGDSSPLSALEETGPLHREVAASGTVYDFTDQESLRRAAETGIEPPREIVSRLEFENDTFLIRFVFGDDLDDITTTAVVDRARFALEAAGSLLKRPDDSNYEREEDRLKFLVGILDGLGAGCLVTNSRSKVVIYNPAIAELLQTDELEDDLGDVVAALTRQSPPGCLRRLLDYLATPVRRNEPGMAVSVLLPSNRPAAVAQFRLTDNPDDLSAIVVVMPAGSTGQAPTEVDFWPTMLHALHGYLHTSRDCAMTLGQSFYNKLGNTGKANLKQLNDSLSESDTLVGGLLDLLHVRRSEEPEQVTDLNALVNRADNAIARRFPDRRITCHFKDLPRIQTSCRQLTFAVENIMVYFTRLVPAARFDIHVDTACTDGSCRLEIFVTADILTDAPTDTSAADAAHPPVSTELAAAGLLIESLGGEIESGTDSEGNHRVICRFPARLE